MTKTEDTQIRFSTHHFYIRIQYPGNCVTIHSSQMGTDTDSVRMRDAAATLLAAADHLDSLK